MAINWRTDYALRLLFELARLGPGARDTVRRTAEAAEVPYDYGRTIARDLVSAGLLVSRRGVGGGIQLARPASEIAILDVLQALEDPASLSLCTHGHCCSRSVTCPVHVGVWQGLDEVIKDYLARSSIGDAVALAAHLEGGPAPA